MLPLTAFKTMNTMVAVLCSERDFWLSIGHKIALAYSPKHSVHYAGSLSVASGLVGKGQNISTGSQYQYGSRL